MQGSIRPSPDVRSHAQPESERGFVLIAAIWLLILAGSITAILMLRSLSAATFAADQQESAARKLLLEGAIETALADRLFDGPRSGWWLMPSENYVTIGGRRITVKMSSESGRLDLNEADPDLIDTALRGFGLEPDERAPVVARLRSLRETKGSLSSHSALEALFAADGVPRLACLGDQFTISSGLAEPRPDQVSPQLARALGHTGKAGGPAQPEPGAALRVEAAEAGGAPLTAIVRVTGIVDHPLAVSAWGIRSGCP